MDLHIEDKDIKIMQWLTTMIMEEFSFACIIHVSHKIVCAQNSCMQLVHVSCSCS